MSVRVARYHRIFCYWRNKVIVDIAAKQEWLLKPDGIGGCDGKIPGMESKMNAINYQKECDRVIERVMGEEKVPTLLLHSCCAPCSSYCLSYLAQYFSITVYYYNPNITEEAEYQKRVAEQKRLLAVLPVKYPVTFAEGPYEPELFLEMAKGLEDVPEGGSRCFQCYEMRLKKAVAYAREHGFDYVTTTLSVSPHKNAGKLNGIGTRLCKEAGVTYLLSDFKKKGGYQQSIALSREYGLYRQNYCGCIYSKAGV